MANYIITKHQEFFNKIGKYEFAPLDVLSELPSTIAFDSETTGLSSIINDMFCVQIGTGKDNYIVHMYNDNYQFEEVIPYIKDCTLVMQNGLFDLGFMYKHNFYPEKVLDTMLASKILYNGKFEWNEFKQTYLPVRHDFGSLMKKHLNIVYDKTDQKNIHLVKLSQPSAIKYSFNDVDRLLELHDALYYKIVKEGAEKTYELHCRFVRALAYMERCGLPLDENLWRAKMKEDQINVKEQTELIEEFIHDELPQFANTQLDFFRTKKEILVSLTSPVQMVKVFNAFKINTKDRFGKDSVKEDIINKSNHPFVKIWLKFQGAKHRVTTFGEGVVSKILNGRIYTSFNPMVDTARLSSRRGSINFLNFPADANTRSCFVAKEGNDMIVCDWSGQETVIAADLSGDAAMTKSVVEGADLHCLLARVLFPELQELSDEEIVKNHNQKRSDSKAPRFAMSYGGNAYTLHINEGISMKRALEIELGFKKLHEGLYEWGEKIFQIAIKKGYIESVDGWKLYLPKYSQFQKLKIEVDSITREEWTKYRIGKAERQREFMIKDHNANLKEGETKKEFIMINKVEYEFYRSKRKTISDYFKLRSEYQRLCLNNPVQTRGSHQMKLALCYFFEWILKKGYINTVLLCNAVHDEIVSECPKELSLEVKNVIGEIMREAGDFYLENLKIKADANIGDSWYAAK